MPHGSILFIGMSIAAYSVRKEVIYLYIPANFTHRSVKLLQICFTDGLPHPVPGTDSTPQLFDSFDPHTTPPLGDADNLLPYSTISHQRVSERKSKIPVLIPPLKRNSKIIQMRNNVRC